MQHRFPFLYGVVAGIRRNALLMIIAAFCFAAVEITYLQGAQQPVFRGRGDAVRVFATVTDRDGRIVPTLGKDDFEIRDEGKPQPLALFDNSPQPIRLVLMLDVSGSMAGNLPLLRSASEQLFPRLLPDDVARIGSFGKQVVISPEFTHDVRALRAAIPTGIDPDAPTPLWRAIDEAMDTFGDDSGVRRVVLVLSDGKDSGPAAFSRNVSSQAGVIDRARNDNVMIYGVGMRSRRLQSQAPGPGIGGLQAAMLADLPDPGLARVAEETGGGYLEVRYGDDLISAFAAVADELHSQYLLGFTPPKRDGKTHKIEVRVRQPGLKVRSQKSYSAPKDPAP
jgi:Ca-activated chloride channel family protein